MLAHVDQESLQRAEVTCPNGTPAFLVQPKAPGSHPGMVVLHERYGLVDNTRDVATRFAAHGYVAIAPNLFWREPDLGAIARGEAGGEVPDTQVSGVVASPLDYLRGGPAAALNRTAVAGYCQTGRHPLAFAS